MSSAVWRGALSDNELNRTIICIDDRHGSAEAITDLPNLSPLQMHKDVQRALRRKTPERILPGSDALEVAGAKCAQ